MKLVWDACPGTGWRSGMTLVRVVLTGEPACTHTVATCWVTRSELCGALAAIQQAGDRALAAAWAEAAGRL